MAKPTVKDLVSSLQNLVRWEEFGLQLPSMDSAKIEKIERRARGDVTDAKRLLFDSWLRIYPDACWYDVVEALEKAKENSIAEELRKRHDLDLIPKPTSKAAETRIKVQKSVVEDLAQLNDDFLSLIEEVKSEIKSQVEGEVKPVAKFVDYVRELRAYEVCFSSVQTVDEFFDAIYPHYNFLDYHMITSLAVHFLSPSTVENAEKYKSDAEAFTQTRKIKALHRQLDRYFKKISQHNSKIQVVISVQNSWGTQTMWRFKMLVKHVFSLEVPDDFQWFRVVCGSLLVVFLASKSMTEIYSQRIRCSGEKMMFIRLAGVISLHIDDHNYFIDSENPHFSFENNFIIATIFSNIEAVVFLLQYMEVNVNVRIARPIHTIADIKDSSFQTEFAIHSDFDMMKSLFISLVEDVKGHVEKLEGQARLVIALDKLLHYSYFLNPNSLTNFFQKVPNILFQNRILEYNDKILWFKKQSKITHLNEPLQKLFPREPDVASSNRFSASLLITLQSAWCNCSVWCIELLVKSIFSFQPFEIFYWYRVSCDPLTVEFRTALDPNDLSLQKTIPEEQFMRFVGVTQLWLLGSRLFEGVNDENYSFEKEIFSAKVHCNMEAVQFLQQIIDEPLAFMYDLDDNNNYSINIDPGSTPLMIACFNDDMELVKKLLHYNADPNIENDRKRTALMYACRNTKMVELLVRKGAEISASDIHGDTVLTWASFIGNVPLVKYVLKCDHDNKLINALREYGQTALHLASQVGHLPVVKELTSKKRINVNIQDARGETPLYAASINGHLPVVKFLLEKEADPDIQESTGETPLYAASDHNHLEIVENLINNKADPNISCNDGQTALHGASMEGHTPIVKYLLQNKADPCATMPMNAGEITPLLLATIGGHLSIVELLLAEKDVNPNCQDGRGCSPLWFASCLGHLPIVKRLFLEDNIIIDIRTNFDETPFQGAIRKGQTEVIEYFQKVARNYSDQETIL